MSGAVKENNETVLPRVLGNLDPIPFQMLDNNGVNINITGKTLKMRLVNIDTGTVKLAAGACTIDVAAEGKGHYTPAAIDMDTKGNYAVYVMDGTNTSDPRYPYDGPKYILAIVGEDGSEQ